jgi:hypothetical protein
MYITTRTELVKHIGEEIIVTRRDGIVHKGKLGGSSNAETGEKTNTLLSVDTGKNSYLLTVGEKILNDYESIELVAEVNKGANNMNTKRSRRKTRTTTTRRMR